MCQVYMCQCAGVVGGDMCQGCMCQCARVVGGDCDVSGMHVSVMHVSGIHGSVCRSVGCDTDISLHLSF